MLNSLRNRLILSHILPLGVAIPLMGLGLAYVLETQVLLPRLAQNLAGDARLLAEISRTEYELWGNPVLFEQMLSRVRADSAERVMFFSAPGQLLYSSDPADSAYTSRFFDLPGLTLAQAGEEVALTNYAPWRLDNVQLDVFAPVTSPDSPVIGVVRVTYQLGSAYEAFWQMRLFILGILAGGLLVGALLGLALAVNISRPVQRVTAAIYEVAQGARQAPLPEQGPLELREQARAVNHLVLRLHSLEQARRQLVANLVHELGRPLGALRAALHALSQGAAQDPQLLHDLTTGMDEETARLQHVLEDVAHLHDQGLGALELKREPLALADWLPRVLAPWEQAAREKRLQWNVSLPAVLPTLFADPMRLAQVVGNLTDNAIKYTPPGRSVTVTAGQEEAQVWIRVTDSGPGISPEEREHIFEPFYRGGQGRRIKQGMGLGLSIARDWAEAHGGRLTVESAPGPDGSQFTLWLPLPASGNSP